MTRSQNPIPLRPAFPSQTDQARALWRSATAIALNDIGGGYDVDGVVRRMWPDDQATATVTKAAVNPASTTGWGAQALPTIIGPMLSSLSGQSAAASLFAAGLRFDLEGVHQILLPALTGLDAPVFIAEGGSIPVVNGTFANATLGPARKLAAIAGMSGEIAKYSANAAEAVVTQALKDAAARSLEAAVFSDAAASSSRPAGILNGVTPITASAATDPFEALVADMKALFAAFGAAGIGSNIMVFVSPAQMPLMTAIIEQGRPTGMPSVRGVVTPALPAGTVVGVEVGAFASGFDPVPQITTSNQAAVHFDDATALAIGTAGTPATVAAPVLSSFQSNLILLRMILRCTWTTRAAGAVQVIEDVAW